MAEQHSPGPWRLACESGEWFVTLADYAPLPDTEANLRLIAAAPELAKWLRWALARIDPQNRGDYYDAAEKLLHDATGE